MPVSALLSFIMAIPGLGKWLANIGLVLGSYAKGRQDASNANEQRAAVRANSAALDAAAVRMAGPDNAREWLRQHLPGNERN